MKQLNSDPNHEKEHLKELMYRSAEVRKQNAVTKEKLDQLKKDSDELLSEQQGEAPIDQP